MSQSPVGAPSWFDLMTPDPDGVQPFYAAVFGWTFTEDSGPEMGHYRMALVDGKTAAGIGKLQGDMPTAWSVYLRTEDADATAEKVTAAGGQVVAPPMDVGDAGRMAIFADVGGAVFGVWQNGQHTGAQVHAEHGAMTWSEVNVPDGPAACAFYGAVFGTESRKMEGMDYWTQHLNGNDAPEFGVLEMNEEWQGMPAHWMPYFRVSDTDAACAQVDGNGGQVRVKAFDTPHGRLAVVADPHGATFMVMGPNKG